MGQGHNTSRAP